MFLKEVDSATFKYTDAISSYEKNPPRYVYAVSSLNDKNRESEMAIPQTIDSSIKEENKGDYSFKVIFTLK